MNEGVIVILAGWWAGAWLFYEDLMLPIKERDGYVILEDIPRLAAAAPVFVTRFVGAVVAELTRPIRRRLP
jgi:hypothetical protein